jgi:hypothetical protein
MSEKSNTIQSDEIFLKEIIDFFIESWKTVATFGLLGLISSFAWIYVTPGKYEAIAQVRITQPELMVQGSLPKVYLDDINTLISRLNFPTTFSGADIQACSSEKSNSQKKSLINSFVSINAIKGTTSLVELRILGETKQEVTDCTKAIVKKIIDLQNATLKPYYEKIRTMLLKNQLRINDIKSLLTKADKGHIEVLASYLSIHDEIEFLLKENLRLGVILDYEDAQLVMMTAPIYVSDSMIYPKRMPITILGLLAGIFFGLLYRIVCRLWLYYRNGWFCAKN